MVGICFEESGQAASAAAEATGTQTEMPPTELQKYLTLSFILFDVTSKKEHTETLLRLMPVFFFFKMQPEYF